MVAQEGGLGLARRVRGPRSAHVFLDGRRGHPDVEFQQLAADVLGVPQAVGHGHLADQGNRFGRDGRPVCRRCGARPPPPELAKELAMPPQHGLGLDDQHGVAPGAEAAR